MTRSDVKPLVPLTEHAHSLCARIMAFAWLLFHCELGDLAQYDDEVASFVDAVWCVVSLTDAHMRALLFEFIGVGEEGAAAFCLLVLLLRTLRRQRQASAVVQYFLQCVARCVIMVVAAVSPIPRGRSLAEAWEARQVWGPLGGFLSVQG